MKSIRRKLLPLLLLAGAGMTMACRSEAQAQARLQAEVDRLQEVLKKVGAAAPPQAKGTLAGFGQQLASIRPQTSPSVFVYQLREPSTGVEQWAFFLDHRDGSKDLAHLEALWTAEKARFAVAPGPVPAAPLLAALAQASENRAEKLYRAALPYGKASGPGAGFYYLGEAEAQMRFHDFVAGLSFPAGGEKIPDAAVLRTVLESLEGEMQKGFAADPGGQEMIPASALLKEARELLERDFRAGAALTLLESRLELSRRRTSGSRASQKTGGAPPPVEKAAEGSLIAPFVAMTAGEQDETARIVRADVIPLYRSFFGKSQ